LGIPWEKLGDHNRRTRRALKARAKQGNGKPSPVKGNFKVVLQAESPLGLDKRIS
jgi:hypothetical protein